ncbi:ribonuclease HII [Clostridia bacterium OttesenSCG-928-F22]|nr:ribonuclease HII [Clostridia bacterium OttesenSCG-928-F22]
MKREELLKQKLDNITTIERELWTKGIQMAGIDEVGRGPLAGPVVAACVVMPEQPLVLGVDDSKKLSAKRREELYQQILDTALYIGIGVVDHHEIDDINILNATKKAMCIAYDSIEHTPDIVLVDAVTLPLPCPVEAIIKGDSKSYSIAAASIVAKVTRDNIMMEADTLYPNYGFSQHKGYGTKAHITSILEYGACPLHRRSFLKNILHNHE